jgi:hypothetical protein
VCALINAYHNARVIDTTKEQEWAAQMLLLLNKENQLKKRLERLSIGRNKPQWRKYDARMVIFPNLSDQDVRNICFGTEN